MFCQFHSRLELYPSDAPGCFLSLLRSLGNYLLFLTFSRHHRGTSLCFFCLGSPCSWLPCFFLFLVYSLILLVYSIQDFMRKISWVIVLEILPAWERCLYSAPTFLGVTVNWKSFFIGVWKTFLLSASVQCCIWEAWCRSVHYFLSHCPDVPWCESFLLVGLVFIGPFEPVDSFPSAFSSAWFVLSETPDRWILGFLHWSSRFFVLLFLLLFSIVFAFCSFWESSSVLFSTLSLIFTVPVTIFLKVFFFFWVFLCQQPVFCKWSIFEKMYLVGIPFPLSSFFSCLFSRLQFLGILSCEVLRVDCKHGVYWRN